MKIIFGISLLLIEVIFLSGTSKAQAAQKPDSSCSKFIFSSVLEVKHTSMIDLENLDKKTVEINIINRYISVPAKIGGSVMIKNNDTISMSLAGITFFPYNWFRLDLMAGIYIKSEGENKKTAAGGIRIWLGSQLIDCWTNIYAGEFFLIEAILLVSVSPEWLKLGIMADNTGWGPMVEVLPLSKTTPNIKIWGAVVGDWRNKNKLADDPHSHYVGYNPYNLYGSVGVKVIF